MNQKKYPLRIVLREPQSSDIDFIYSTFVRSLTNQYPWKAKKIIDAFDDKKIVRDGIDKNWAVTSAHTMCTRLMRNCSILVACDPGDYDQTFGYIMFSDGVLHWLYSKYDFRKAGVATRLMENAFPNFKKNPIDYTIKTSAIRHLVEKWKLRFNSHHLTRLGRRENETN